MNRNHLWRLLIIVGVIIWSLIEMYPPTNRDLVQFFREKAVQRDETFTKIYTQAQELQKTRSDRAYENLQDAIGTNSIVKYFPFFEAGLEKDPTISILNRLQREAVRPDQARPGPAGRRVHPGQTRHEPGGRTSTRTRSPSARTPARRRCRRRWKSCANVWTALVWLNRVIQPEGNDRILIQLPGLSHAQMETAKKTIQKVAYLEFKLVHPQSEELLKQSRVPPPGYQTAESHPGRQGWTHADQLVSGQKAAGNGRRHRARRRHARQYWPALEICSPSNPRPPVSLAEITTRKRRPSAGHRAGRRIADRAQHQHAHRRAAAARLPAISPMQEAFTLAQRPGEPAQNAGATSIEFERSGSDARQRLDPQRHQGRPHRRHRRRRLHAGLLPVCRRGGERGADAQHHHSARRHVFHRHHAHAAGHRRRRADHRHGGGRQRADLRTHSRGTGRRQIHARRAVAPATTRRSAPSSTRTSRR